MDKSQNVGTKSAFMPNNFSLAWVEFEEKSFKSYWTNWVLPLLCENLREKCFWKLLEVLMCITYHKNWFSAKFPGF